MKILFDCYPPRRASIMRMYFAGFMQVHAVEVMGNTETIKGSEIFTLIDMAISEMSKQFNADPDVLFREITDAFDATIWADLPGGINDPEVGKDNPYYINRTDTN